MRVVRWRNLLPGVARWLLTPSVSSWSGERIHKRTRCRAATSKSYRRASSSPKVQKSRRLQSQQVRRAAGASSVGERFLEVGDTKGPLVVASKAVESRATNSLRTPRLAARWCRPFGVRESRSRFLVTCWRLRMAADVWPHPRLGDGHAAFVTRLLSSGGKAFVITTVGGRFRGERLCAGIGCCAPRGGFSSVAKSPRSFLGLENNQLIE